MSFTFCPCLSCGKLNKVALDMSNQKEPICGSCKSALPLHFGVVEANGDGLKKLIAKSSLPVVCDFWAPWCGPCRAFAPTFTQAAAKMAGKFVFVKLNTEAHQEAGSAYSVRSIPTLISFKEGKEVNRMSGALPLPEFLEWLGSQI